MGHKISKEQIDPGVKDHIMSFVGDINELETNEKSNIIDAVNSLVVDRIDNAENMGKLANAIGEPVTANHSVDEVVNELGEMLSAFKTNMVNSGVVVENGDKFKELIDKVQDISSDIENTRSTLAEILQKDGYYITGEEDIDSLLDLLILSGINVNDIKQIACGSNHTFILKNDGSVWSCGYNASGQLGLGNNTSRNIFTQVTTNINDIKQITCSGAHTFILKNDGSVWSCGYNNAGQLGLGDNTDRNTFTQVTTNISDIKQIVCGFYHTFILKNDGSVWACGRNDNGELGLGDTTNRNTFTQVTTNINNDVKQIACGENHTIIIKNDGSIYSCGANDKGQLGLNDTTNRNIFTQTYKTIYLTFE